MGCNDKSVVKKEFSRIKKVMDVGESCQRGNTGAVHWKMSHKETLAV